MTLGQILLSVLQVSPFSTIQPMLHIHSSITDAIQHRRTNPSNQVTMETISFMVAFNICGSSVWNVLHVSLSLLVTRILKWLPDFWKMCAPLIYKYHQLTVLLNKIKNLSRNETEKLISGHLLSCFVSYSFTPNHIWVLRASTTNEKFNKTYWKH